MPRFQFSMRWMMVAITAACILLFLAVTLGDFFEIIIATVVLCVIPTPIVIFALYAKRDLQAFAIGALIPWVSSIVILRPPMTSILSISFWLLPTSAACGAIAAVTRRWIEANLLD